ncbi:MAG: hypothetical protein Q7R47_05255 [Candidatus Diapherotrites archaeon]|nr:hypothetical protein [Candidatus Diapherotrites archaeon]
MPPRPKTRTFRLISSGKNTHALSDLREIDKALAHSKNRRTLPDYDHALHLGHQFVVLYNHGNPIGYARLAPNPNVENELVQRLLRIRPGFRAEHWGPKLQTAVAAFARRQDKRFLTVFTPTKTELDVAKKMAQGTRQVTSIHERIKRGGQVTRKGYLLSRRRTPKPYMDST